LRKKIYKNDGSSGELGFMYISNPFVPMLLKLQKIKVGKKARFYGLPVVINKSGKITIGNNFTLSSAFLANLVGMWQRSILFARDGGEIVIGDNVGMSAVTVYAFKKIEIGDNTIIGANTKIFDSDFHPADPIYRLNNADDKTHTGMKETIIGQNVFVGCNSIILKGVTIGDNAVVGAGSVVSKDVPPNCIVAGNPAKVIKFFENE